MLAFGLFYPLYIASVYKSFGSAYLSDETLTLAGALGSIGNGCSRVIWATLQDKYGFKPVYTFAMVIQLVVSSSIYFFRDNAGVYIAWVTLSYFCEGAHFSMFPVVAAKVFGIKNGGTIFTIIYFAVPITATISLILSTYVNGIPKWAVYIVGAALTFINLILLYLFDETPMKNEPKGEELTTTDKDF